MQSYDISNEWSEFGNKPAEGLVGFTQLYLDLSGAEGKNNSAGGLFCPFLLFHPSSYENAVVNRKRPYNSVIVIRTMQ